MSRVRNIVVSNVEIFEEELIKELIKNEISYVQIENEFHFLDHIYRIYDLEFVAKVFSQEQEDLLDGIFVRVPETLSKQTYPMSTKERIEYIPNDYPSKIDFYKDNDNYKMNKKLIKQQNRQVNRIMNRK